MSAIAGSDAISLPGHPSGQALETVDAYSAWFQRYAAWALEGPLVVVGNSLGGAVAMRWALDFPNRTAALVLIGTGARLRVSDRIMAMVEHQWPACIDGLVDAELAPDAESELRERVRSWHITVGQESTARDFRACDRFDIMNQVCSIEAPTLVMVGSRDQLTPVKYARYLHDKISRSRLAVVEGAGHLTMTERPSETTACIRGFLDGLA